MSPTHLSVKSHDSNPEGFGLTIYVFGASKRVSAQPPPIKWGEKRTHLLHYRSHPAICQPAFAYDSQDPDLRSMSSRPTNYASARDRILDGRRARRTCYIVQDTGRCISCTGAPNCKRPGLTRYVANATVRQISLRPPIEL